MALSEMKFQKYFVDTYGEQVSDGVAICALCVHLRPTNPTAAEEPTAAFCGLLRFPSR